MGRLIGQAFEDYVPEVPRVEKYLQYHMYTDTAQGGLGLHTASWAGMCALIQLVQKVLWLADHKMSS